MIVSIDYDDTYTRDPELWDIFCSSLLERGHTVWCVSARSQHYMSEAIGSIGLVIGEDKCIGTNGVAKRDFLFRNFGVYADVWVDDMPDTITTGYEVGESSTWVTQFDGSK